MATSGNRAIDMLITYRIMKVLSTPFEQQDAFKYGVIDKKGKVLRKYNTLSKPEEKKAYTWLHRFLFNVKRILGKVGLGSRLGTLAAALGILLKERLTITDFFGDVIGTSYLEKAQKILQKII